MATREQWADAYYEQARSDWALFTELLARADVSPSHSLHYLQMATEKLAKAYRFRDTETAVDTLLTSHVGFHQFLNVFLRSPVMRLEYSGRTAQLERLRHDCGKLSRAVEKLAPGVDRVGHPGNTEYPWSTGDAVVIPVRWSFPELSLLREPAGRIFLKFVERAFHGYADQDLPRHR